MDRDTLYELRATLALYPYFQTIRLLMLQNLYILHDPEFNEELRRASVQITDRRVIFDMVERAHTTVQSTTEHTAGQPKSPTRTTDLIDSFLLQMPPEEEEKQKKRKPTPADAAIDYVAYLLETTAEPPAPKKPNQLKGHDLIDDFIEKEGGRITLSDTTTLPDNNEKTTLPEPEETYFTETLARIYIKQGRYSKALEIIKRINLDNPKKNAYFADQIRFLEKLIINNKQKQ